MPKAWGKLITIRVGPVQTNYREAVGHDGPHWVETGLSCVKVGSTQRGPSSTGCCLSRTTENHDFVQSSQLRGGSRFHCVHFPLNQVLCHGKLLVDATCLPPSSFGPFPALVMDHSLKVRRDYVYLRS
jgi:hypothetical protein